MELGGGGDPSRVSNLIKSTHREACQLRSLNQLLNHTFHPRTQMKLHLLPVHSIEAGSRTIKGHREFI